MSKFSLALFLLPTLSLYAGSDEHFESKVRPLLHDNCIKCHGPEKQKGSLRLDHIDFILEGGESGPVINLKKPETSLLVEAIQYQHEDLQMPPKKAGGPLSKKEQIILIDWVLSGANWPKETKPQVGFVPGKIQQADREWWAFQPVKNTTPNLKSNWAQNKIDLFIEAKLKSHELKPAPKAQKHELIRRLSFDLRGIPPRPEEVIAFEKDDSPKAYEKLVDQFLNSPMYGERWAQHWLDVVRFAESDGYRADHFRTQAYRYRDYVVKSLNQDKPYDVFLKEQIAGDELDPGNADALDATMFLRHWIYEWNQRDVETQWDIILNDITETTSDAFMGMSLACAKCHNHKFDPILQKDYYRFQAFFQAILPTEKKPIASLEQMATYRKALDHYNDQTRELRLAIHDIEVPLLLKHAKGQGFSKFIDKIKDMISKHPEQRTAYEEQIASMALRQLKINREDIDKHLPIEKKEHYENLKKKLTSFASLKPKPLPTKSFLVHDAGTVAPPTLIPDAKDKSPILPGYMTIFKPEPAHIPTPPKALNTTGRRSALAHWLTQEDNPLTARVMVNRLWQNHFGRGIVATPNNFGRLGERPTHPKLLDYLAHTFVENDWSMKAIHKLICMSATYQQSSKVTPALKQKELDPSNHWLWRFPALRLDAEQIRDSILSASGQIETHKLGGKSIKGSDRRRSLYVKRMRNNPDKMLNRFNAPQGFKSTPSRNITNTPLQSLLLFNSEWPLAQAKHMAKRLEKDHKTLEEQIQQAFLYSYSRSPSQDELKASKEFIESMTTKDKASQQLALADFCHVLINSNEFINLH